jgi:uncharacterized protein
MQKKEIAVLYHGSCPDGFGGAYSAWKKFGETATYEAVYHGDAPPDVSDQEVYVIDFSYPKEILLEMERRAKRLVILDHHLGAREIIAVVREHIFDNDHSGSGIAWKYFHPNTPLPRLLAYIEDNDLFKRSLSDWKEVGAYISTVSFAFESFDALVRKVDTEEGFAAILEKGHSYNEYVDFLCNSIAVQAEEVQFDEFKILAVNAPRLLKARIGEILAQRQGQFALVWYPNHGKWHFSLIGNGSIDCSEIAKRYGGNGHPNAAAFRLPLEAPLPFIRLKKESDENSSN